MRVTRLRCEYLTDPIGIGEARPRLAWSLDSTRAGARPTASRVLVASRPGLLSPGEADLWDSGVVEGGHMEAVYGGPELGSRMEAFWAAHVLDERGEWAASPPASFEMGLLRPEDWVNGWLAVDVPLTGDDGRGCPMLRSEFELDASRGIRRARLYATALGLYRPFLNGSRVGDACFTPGWTDYRKRVHYQTYDVTALVRPGANALGVVLADGWYAGYVGFGGGRELYGSRLQVRLQLVLDHEDGTSTVAPRSDAWRMTFGPWVAADLLMGESYDARLELPGWSEPGFDGGDWRPVAAGEGTSAALEAQPCEPVRATAELRPDALREVAPGVAQVDFGQILTGWVRLRVVGAEAGATITIRHAEVLDPATGRLYTTNLRAAKATDRFVAAGLGDELFEPAFTFHGFRYVEIDGLPAATSPGDVSAVVAHTDVASSGTFECGHPLVERLQQNIVWSLRGNFVDVPTDCPQRDERLGWMGDALVIARTAVLNLDVSAFFAKWVTDVLDAVTSKGSFPNVAPRVVVWGQGAPGWGDAGVTVPFELYESYGDVRLLERTYPAMCRWIAYIADQNPDGVWRHGRSYDFGDWVSLADTPKEPLSTAYYANSLDLVARTAAILQRSDEAADYRAMHAATVDAFRREYVSADGRIEGETQTIYAVAIRHGLLDGSAREAAARHLAADVERHGHPTVGFLGIRHLLPALAETGRADLAYELLLREDFPSWGFQIRHGATTMWERWDGWTPDGGFQDPSMNSFNHYAFGGVGEWLFEGVAGLRRAAPAWARLDVEPNVTPRIGSATAGLVTPAGYAESSWDLDEQRLRMTLVVPPGVTASVRVPAPDARHLPERDEPELEATSAADATTFETSSGRYVFESPPP